MAKRWTGSVVFAPLQRESDRLAITTLKAWRLKEPVSGRRYTVVKLESRGGAVGYGECGPSVGSEIAEAKAVIVGKRATDAEFIRHHLASSPGMESAVNNAMLDVAARSANVPIYQFLGGPTRFKARVVAHLEGEDEEALVSSLQRGMQRGFRAFSFPIPPRDAMWRMQAYVDVIRGRHHSDVESRGPCRCRWHPNGSASCEGPVGGIASLHVDAAIPNFLCQEICGAVQ